MFGCWQVIQIQTINMKQQQKRVNVDFPIWVIDSLDKEAGRLGVSRQPIIKLWLVEKLEQIALTRRST